MEPEVLIEGLAAPARRLLFARRDDALVEARQHAAQHLHGHLGPVDEIGAVERLAEGHRVAGNQGQLDAVPVLATQVVDVGPAAQPRRPLLTDRRQAEAVGGLPQRHRDDVADAHGAPALALGRDLQRAAVLDPVRGDGFERLVHLGLQLRVGERDRLGLLQDELPNALGRDQADPVADGRAQAVGQGDGLGPGAEDASHQVAIAGRADLGALQAVEQRRRGFERIGPERQVAEHLGQGLPARQADLTDAAGVVVDHDAFQHVVDLVEVDLEGEFRVALDLGRILEVTDPAARQHDPLEHELAGRGPGRQDGEGETEKDKDINYLSENSAGRGARGAHDLLPRWVVGFPHRRDRLRVKTGQFMAVRHRRHSSASGSESGESSTPVRPPQSSSGTRASARSRAASRRPKAPRWSRVSTRPSRTTCSPPT